MQTLKPSFFRVVVAFCVGNQGCGAHEKHRVLCGNLSLLARTYDQSSDAAEKPYRSVLWSRRPLFFPVSMPENLALIFKENLLPSSFCPHVTLAKLTSFWFVFAKEKFLRFALA